MIGTDGAPSVAFKYPMPRSRNAMSRKKKSRKNATVERSVQRTRIEVKMNQPIRNRPNALVKSSGPAPVAFPVVASVVAYAAWMSNPPGVRTIAKEIQNPPYEDRAVAPKVFPTAISLPIYQRTTAKMRLRSITYHMPASSCTSPPYPKAKATTMLGSVKSRVPTLIRERIKVVNAKALRPRGAGLANLREGGL